MLKITVPLPEEKQIEINGHVFDLRADDVDILNRALEIEAKYSEFNSSDSREIIAGINEIVAYVNDFLGDKGAVRKIADGRGVSLNYAVSVMRAIVEEIGKEYGQRVSEDYE